MDKSFSEVLSDGLDMVVKIMHNTNDEIMAELEAKVEAGELEPVTEETIISCFGEFYGKRQIERFRKNQQPEQEEPADGE